MPSNDGKSKAAGIERRIARDIRNVETGWKAGLDHGRKVKDEDPWFGCAHHRLFSKTKPEKVGRPGKSHTGRKERAQNRLRIYRLRQPIPSRGLSHPADCLHCADFRLSRRITARSNAFSARNRISLRCFLSWCSRGVPSSANTLEARFAYVQNVQPR